MMTNLQEALAVTLGMVNDYAHGGVELTQAHAPVLAQEVLARARAIETLNVLTLLLLVTGGVYCAYLLFKHGKRWTHATNDEEVTSTGKILVSGAGAVFGVLGIIGIACHAASFYTAWFCPKLYLVEYVAEMIK